MSKGTSDNRVIGFNVFVTFLFTLLLLSCSPSPTQIVGKADSSLTGKVFFSNIDDYSGVEIILSKDGKIVDTCITIYDGSFFFPFLYSGNYDITYTCKHSVEKEIVKNILVQPSSYVIAEDVCFTAVGSIKGQLLLDDQESRCNGFFVSLSGTECYAVTDYHGFFEIVDVPIGNTYNMFVSKDLYISSDVGTVSAGDNAIIRIYSEDVGSEENCIIWKDSLDYAPESPCDGWAYFNTVESKVYIYKDLQWKELVYTSDCSQGHTLIDSVEKEPSCIEQGLTDGLCCLICGYSTQEVIEMGPHTKVIDTKGNSPSLLHSGIADISHCGLCGKVLSNGEYLPVSEPRKGNGKYRFDKYKQDSAEQRLYDDFFVVSESLIEDCIDVEENELGYCVLGSFKPEDYGLTDDEMVAVWVSFLSDNPRYYFLKQTATFVENGFLLLVDEEYSTREKRRRYDKTIEVMSEECGRLFSATATDITKASQIHDYINSKITYAFQSDGVTPETPDSCVWAHNITGVSYLGRGVCEAYAKTFLYLCNLYGVDCILVNGYSGEEEHSWNYACFDGSWYLIDLTFDDTNDKENSYAYFGINAEIAEIDYQPWKEDGLGIEHQPTLPELNRERLYVVDLYKNGVYLGVYKSPDDAFSSMKGKDNEYELFLKHDSGMSIFYNSLISQLPDVKLLTLSAQDKYRDDGQVFFIEEINFEKNIKLNSDLVLRNICLYINEFKLEEHDLYFEGHNVTISSSFVSNGDNWNYGNDVPKIYGKGSNIVSSPECTVEIWPKLIISDIYVGNTNFTIRNSSLIENLHGDIRIFGATPHVSISNWFCDDREYNTNIYITYEAVVEIGDVFGEYDKNFSINPTFEDYAEYPSIYLKGECNSEVVLYPNGSITHQITDMEGNVIFTETIEADPFDITKPLIVLNPKIEYSQLQIQTLLDNTSIDYFKDFCIINEKNEVFVSPEIIKDEVFYYLGDKIIRRLTDSDVFILPERYSIIGEEVFRSSNLKSLIIPEGYKSIERYAFAKAIVANC